MTRYIDAGAALHDATHPAHPGTPHTPIAYGYDGLPTMAHLPRAFASPVYSPFEGLHQPFHPYPHPHQHAIASPYGYPHQQPHAHVHTYAHAHAPAHAHALALAPAVQSPAQAHAQGLASPGLGINDLDDMKRALDVSSLPLNPVTGTMPFIDPEPSVGVPKKARHSPLLSPGQPGMGAFNSQPATATFGHFPPSPMHFGGPLTPTVPGRQQSLTVPSTPVMFMPTSPILSPSMNPNIMTGNYGPAAAAAAAAAAGNLTGRTVYVGNLPADASVDELLNLVRFGPIESVRLLPERSCVFISFLDGSTAAGFHADAQVKKLALHGQELKIGWGKASNLAPHIGQEVQQNQATRNVFVGNLDEATTEQSLRDALSSFGPVDQVKIVRDKNIGFVHFLSIATAIAVVNQLNLVPGFEDKRVSYGKDRCAYVPKAQQAAVQLAQQQALAAVQAQHGMPSPFFSPMTPNFFATPFGSPMSPAVGSFFSPDSSAAAVASTAATAAAANQLGNRNIYLGNLMPGTLTEELCNNVRGGQLQHIKHMQDKNIAFITFVDPQCAQAFYTHATQTGLTVNTRRLKIGWGKHSGVIAPALLQAIQSGASRNVYIGQILDFNKFTPEKLREDFGQFGEIEMVNFLKEKGAAFVNFTSIVAAQAAIEGIQNDPEYADMRVSYGKDRCANMPRSTAGNVGPAGTGRPSAGRTSSGGFAGNGNGSGLSNGHGNGHAPVTPTGSANGNSNGTGNGSGIGRDIANGSGIVKPESESETDPEMDAAVAQTIAAAEARLLAAE